MKKLLIATTMFFSLSNAFAQGLSGDTWAAAKASKQGKITVTYTHAPKFAEVKLGERKGLCFDIMYEFMAYVQAKHGVNLVIDYKNLADNKDFDLFLKTVKSSNGGVFGLGDVTITSARKQAYNFGAPYFSNVAILATSNKVPTLSNMANISKEFAGKTIVIQNGTTHEFRANALKKNFPGLVVETTTGFNEANQKVANDVNYFTYIDFSTYLDVVTKRIPLKRHEVGDEKGEDFGFIMPKNSDWAPIFNEFMAADGGFTKSVAYRKILADNLGSHVLKLMDAITK
jgi:putative glutamine transport system substrate-binding protein